MVLIRILSPDEFRSPEVEMHCTHLEGSLSRGLLVRITWSLHMGFFQSPGAYLHCLFLVAVTSAFILKSYMTTPCRFQWIVSNLQTYGIFVYSLDNVTKSLKLCFRYFFLVNPYRLLMIALFIDSVFLYLIIFCKTS